MKTKSIILNFFLLLFLLSQAFCLEETIYFDPTGTPTHTEAGSDTDPFRDFRDVLWKMKKVNFKPASRYQTDFTIELQNDWNDVTNLTYWSNREELDTLSLEMDGGKIYHGLIDAFFYGRFTFDGNGHKVSTNSDGWAYSLLIKASLDICDYLHPSVYLHDINIERTNTKTGLSDAGHWGGGIRFYDCYRFKVENCSITINGLGFGAAISVQVDETTTNNELNSSIVNCTITMDGDRWLHAFYFINSSRINVMNCNTEHHEKLSLKPGVPIALKSNSNNNNFINCSISTDDVASEIPDEGFCSGWHESSGSQSSHNGIKSCTFSGIAKHQVHLNTTGDPWTPPANDFTGTFYETWEIYDPVSGADPAIIKTTNTYPSTTNEFVQLLTINTLPPDFTYYFDATKNLYKIEPEDPENYNRPASNLEFEDVQDLRGNNINGVSGSSSGTFDYWVVKDSDVEGTESKIYDIIGNNEKIEFTLNHKPHGNYDIFLISSVSFSKGFVLGRISEKDYDWFGCNCLNGSIRSGNLAERFVSNLENNVLYYFVVYAKSKTVSGYTFTAKPTQSGITNPPSILCDDITTASSLPLENSPFYINHNIELKDGATLNVEDGVELVLLQGEEEPTEFRISGQLVASGLNISGDSGSKLTFNSPFIAGSTTDFNLGDSLCVAFNDPLTMMNGSNMDFGSGATVNYCDNVVFNSGSNCSYGTNSQVNFEGQAIFAGDGEFKSYSEINFADNVAYNLGASYMFRTGTYSTFEKKCAIDSAATVNFDHANLFVNDSLLVYGQLWVDNTVLDFGDDSTKAQGIVYEGAGASLSRITDSIVQDCIDGMTIINSSPLIKTSELLNMYKRGFNIIGIDAEPEVRECLIHLTGTYPLQLLSEANPTFVDNKIYGVDKTAARIWGADGIFTRNEFRSIEESGVFTFSSTAAPQFYSFADSGGNIFDMSNIGSHAIFVGGGNPLLGDYPNITGNNIIKNRGSDYYIYNDTPGTLLAELNWWPGGTGTGSFYNADGGSVDTSPKLDVEPPAGPLLLKAATSPFNSGLQKYQQKDYAGAMEELKQSLQRDKTSIKADQAVFRMGKAARKIGRLGELESFLGDLKKESDPQIQYHSRNWLCYLYASQNKMKKAEKMLDEVPKGSSLERTMLLDLCSYYASWKDMKNAERIAGILKERHNNDVLDMELEAALEGWVNFSQVKGKTRVKHAFKQPIPAPDVTEETESVASAGTVLLQSGTYPNPFNSSTTINFKVEKDGPVQIAIYDLLGRHVQTLVDEHRVAGSYHTIWNGCDNTGRSVASGVYFVRMQAGGQVHSFKISYLK